jgi:hypothetical protein
MTSHSAWVDHPNTIIVPDEDDTRNLAVESDSVRSAGRLLTTSGYVEAAGVLVGSSMNAHETSTSLKRKRTKSKELSDLVCPDFVT